MEQQSVRRVVVTGGAQGIGQACCLALAAEGWQVVVVDRKARVAEAFAATIGAAWYAVDVADDAALRDCAAAVEGDVGPVTGLVNCAGISQLPLPPEDLTMAVYDKVVAVDQRGTYASCVAFGVPMTRRRQGAIVNIASINGMRSVPLHAYGPAKAAVLAITECLAAEWGPSGVRVNTVSPGFTRTKNLEANLDSWARNADLLERDAALQRMVRPEEVAHAVTFLLSERASAITGVNLPVDCGWLVASAWSTYGGVRNARRMP